MTGNPVKDGWVRLGYCQSCGAYTWLVAALDYCAPCAETVERAR